MSSESTTAAPEGVEEDFLATTNITASPTTFEAPIVGNEDVPDIKRKVTVYISGSVNVNGALEKSTITLKQDDLREAIGVGKDQWVPNLSGAKISHYFNPTSQRLGLRIKGSGEKTLVEDAAMARNPFTQKMEGFTAVVPSVTQGNLDQPLVPINAAKSMSPEQAAMVAKWRGLKTSDLTDGLMEVRMPNADGSSTVVMYNVPLVKKDGNPQPVAHMLEKNKEQFPGFQGDDIKGKIHEFDGAHYYSVPPNYVHYLIGSMEENLIRKGGFSTDGDIEVEITPLSPILNSQMRNAPDTAKSENMERMVALELSFDGLDMSAE